MDSGQSETATCSLNKKVYKPNLMLMNDSYLSRLNVYIEVLEMGAA